MLLGRGADLTSSSNLPICPFYGMPGTVKQHRGQSDSVDTHRLAYDCINSGRNTRTQEFRVIFPLLKKKNKRVLSSC